MYEIYPSLQHYLLLGSETRNKCPNKNKWIYVLGQLASVYLAAGVGMGRNILNGWICSGITKCFTSFWEFGSAFQQNHRKSF